VKKALLYNLLFLLLAGGCFSCKKQNVVESDTQLYGPWYVVDYPLYQDCDRGSWICLMADGTCQAELLCNDPVHNEGTWSREGDRLTLECNLLPGSGVKKFTVTSLTDTELVLHTYYVIAMDLVLSRQKPE